MDGEVAVNASKLGVQPTLPSGLSALARLLGRLSAQEYMKQQEELLDDNQMKEKSC